MRFYRRRLRTVALIGCGCHAATRACAVIGLDGGGYQQKRAGTNESPCREGSGLSVLCVGLHWNFSYHPGCVRRCLRPARAYPSRTGTPRETPSGDGEMLVRNPPWGKTLPDNPVHGSSRNPRLRTPACGCPARLSREPWALGGHSTSSITRPLNTHSRRVGSSVPRYLPARRGMYIWNNLLQ